ncbi:hypothetical protein IWW50_000111 [Coemansia erecta]|nr:hypothetical protein GGF43_005281 [Coemansia sp. RSA 2618]KAJ2830709.1 hypothetical protein IWW50_000111 [Coemansia erecta]
MLRLSLSPTILAAGSESSQTTSKSPTPEQTASSAPSPTLPTKQSVPVYRRDTTKERKYPCTTCGKRFTRPSSLACHRRIHTGEKPHMCRFPGCGKQFSVQSNLRRHMRIHEKAQGGSPVVVKKTKRAKAGAAPTPTPSLVWDSDDTRRLQDGGSLRPMGLTLDVAAWSSALDMSALYADLDVPLTAPVGPAFAQGLLPMQGPRVLLTPPPQGAFCSPPQSAFCSPPHSALYSPLQTSLCAQPPQSVFCAQPPQTAYCAQPTRSSQPAAYTQAAFCPPLMQLRPCGDKLSAAPPLQPTTPISMTPTTALGPIMPMQQQQQPPASQFPLLLAPCSSPMPLSAYQPMQDAQLAWSFLDSMH